MIIVVAAAFVMAMGGCRNAQSPQNVWTRNYHPNPAAIALRDVGMATPAQIRLCTPEQVGKAAAAEQKYRDEHIVAREDETLEDQRKILEHQLPILRIRDPAESVMLLGECAFTQDKPVSDSDPRLISLGQAKGATFIVLCLFPREKGDDMKLSIKPNWVGGWGGKLSSKGKYGVAAWFYRRLTPEEQQEVKAKSAAGVG